MKGISKNATIILIIILVFGVLMAAVLGFMSGSRIAAKENKKKDIIEKIDKKVEIKEEKEKVLDVVANSEIEFVTDIANTYEKFLKSQADKYVIRYDKFVFTALGEKIAGTDDYKLKDFSIEFDGNKINKPLDFNVLILNNENNIDVSFTSDGVNTLYTIIVNLPGNSGQASSYIISFNQLGEVILNESNPQMYYYIEGTVVDNVEVKNLVSIFALGDYVYGNDSLNVCSEEYLNMVKDYPAETVVYSKKVYSYVNNTLNVIGEESRTIADDKIFKGC